VPVGTPDELELLEDEELLLDEELEELLEDEELEELLLDEELDELLEDELELLELDELLLVLPPLIEPAAVLNTTDSSFAPSSRRRIRRVWAPAARLVKVATVKFAQPLVCILFCAVQAPESSL
jgi:hypothetical protein